MHFQINGSMMQVWISETPRVLVVLYLLAVIFTDWRWRRIPNTLSVPTAVIGLVVWTMLDGWAGLGFSLLGLVVGLLILLIPFMLGGIGGGDVKFLAAVGALLGPWDVFLGFLPGAILAGVVAWLINLRHPLAFGPRYSLASVGLLRLKEATGKWFFPFGIPVALGYLGYLIYFFFG